MNGQYTVSVTDVPTTEYSYYDPRIYSVQQRREGNKKYWRINYCNLYPVDEWTADEAIREYLNSLNEYDTTNYD